MAMSPSKQLHFVPSDGIQNRDTKPESQRYRTAARKHVMRVKDIGLLRRKKPVGLLSVTKGEILLEPVGVQQRPQGKESVETIIDEGAWSTLLPERRTALGRSQSDGFCLVNTQQVKRRDAAQHGLRRGYSLLHGTPIDTFTAWPVVPTARMRYLLDYFLRTKCRSMALFRSAFWQFFALDPGLYYQGLAFATLCCSTHGTPSGQQSHTSEALCYYTKGLTSVNKRLGRASATQDNGILVSIFGLTFRSLSWGTGDRWCWERDWRIGDKAADEWALHVAALKTILDGRGGVATLDRHTEIRTALMLVDVEGAFTRDVPPTFSFPPHILAIVASVRMTPPPATANCVKSWETLLRGRREVIDIFAEAASMTAWLSVQHGLRDGTLWTRQDRYHDWPVLLVYRCLELRRSASATADMRIDSATEDDRSSTFANALRCAMLLFLARVRGRFGIPVSGTDKYLPQLQSGLHFCLKQYAASAGLQRLMFWMLIVGGMEASILGDDVSWYCTRIAARCDLVGASSLPEIGETVRRAVVGLPWLEEVNGPCLTLLLESIGSHME